ncbi:pyridoxal phosphate-dependent aminotransferase [Candidatus Pacearchaeota archaeon]|nr:pyridoxal phosphate-dependent aminotransferase [Candidatus Pacearchaeota archaeon]
MEKELNPSMFIGVGGGEIISFGAGQPDLPPPKEIYDVLHNAHNNFRYGLIQGNENLRAALSKQYPGSDKDDFIITNGASEALDLVLRVIGKGGGKVLLHKPYYYSYPPLVRAAGLEPVYTETINGKIDLADFKEKIKDCKAFLINSPSNPTGRIQDVETLKEIERITKEREIILISDEVYKDMIYERENYLLSGPQVVTINSFSKTFAMCGFRVGYLYSNDKSIVKNVIDLKTHTSMNTNTLAQEMAYVATTVPKEYLEKGLKIWKERRDLICKGLKDMGLDFWKPEGAFYVLPKVDNPKKAVLELFEKHKVITYLGDWFGAPGRIRLSYALDKEKIEEGLKRIKEYLGK